MPKADANIRIGADTTAFTTQMAGLEKGITEKMAKIGNVFMGAMGLAAGAKGIASAFSAFTQPAAELENVATSLGVVMGNAEAAERLTGSLERLATNGVVGFDELHRSARALTNVFQDDAVISHYVSRMADIAAGADIPASRLAELVARMEDVGKAELTELANKGVPIYEALAEVMGKSRDEVVKMGNEGKIGCSALLAAFEKLTDAGGRYHNMNATMSNTAKGSWDTLKASITECMAALGEPINDSIRPVLQELATWVQENKASIKEIGAQFKPVAQNLAASMKVAMPGIIGVAKAIGSLAETVGGPLVSMISMGTAVAVRWAGSYHGVAIALALLSAKMQGPFASAARKVMAIKRLMRIKMKKYRAEVIATGSSFKVIMAGMAASAKAALISIKAAFARNAITLAVLALGEAVGWLYTKFSDAEDAAKDMGVAAEDAAAATNEALEASRREMELKEVAQRREQDRTRQMEEQARLAQEAADAEKERLRTVAEMARARRDNDFEREMDALREIPEGLNGGTGGVIRARLRRVGAPSEEALYAERDRLELSGSMSEEQQRRYEQVAAAISKIEEEHRKAEEAARTHRQEMERLRDNYYDRKSTYNRGRKDAAYEEKSIGGQERQLRRDAQAAGYWGEMNPAAIREHLDELAKADVKGNEDSIAALERILQLHDELVERKQRYQAARATDMQELRIQALELAGRKRAADALRQELEIQQRITELRERGATPRQAKQQAEMEAKVRAAAEQRARIQSARVEFIQGHQANVGGGGVSFRLGNSQLQESKKHGRLLKEIRDYLRGQRNTASGVAVLA
ncbi:MAG: tape measure protein [Akkermansia sp.]|nr:tape measure protein [Akkermansia sp.]